ncbi:hypothetical protein GCM10022379_04350 [Micromonospora maritima]
MTAATMPTVIQTFLLDFLAGGPNGCPGGGGYGPDAGYCPGGGGYGGCPPGGG